MDLLFAHTRAHKQLPPPPPPLQVNKHASQVRRRSAEQRAGRQKLSRCQQVSPSSWLFFVCRAATSTHCSCVSAARATAETSALSSSRESSSSRKPYLSIDRLQLNRPATDRRRGQYSGQTRWEGGDAMTNWRLPLFGGAADAAIGLQIASSEIKTHTMMMMMIVRNLIVRSTRTRPTVDSLTTTTKIAFVRQQRQCHPNLSQVKVYLPSLPGLPGLPGLPERGGKTCRWLIDFDRSSRSLIRRRSQRTVGQTIHTMEAHASHLYVDRSTGGSGGGGSFNQGHQR